ncbi:MAG: hypothetical protein JO328_21000 [Hyphomicrobiales bacterium]|nr:hypothetical protein [Hyphomicrobiales bacterium]MBV8826714.1 hypothetical protein [Hyphomicrobiales bacterium]MBV9427857.1 hypothetical protein [Bradyrhizobiaceae bacterium]
MSNLTRRSTSEELADPKTVTREDVLSRLTEWRQRVHELYDDIEQALQGHGFQFDREGKHTTSEGLVQAAGVTPEEQPKIDILRIVRPDGTNAANFFPRGPWVIGANGQVDLRLSPSAGRSHAFTLMDQSGPFSNPFWIRMPVGSPFEREPFDPAWLLSKIDEQRSR